MHKLPYTEIGCLLAGLQRLNCNVQADLIPELEAVCDRLRGAIDMYRDAIQLVHIDPFRKGTSGELKNAHRRPLNAWLLGAPFQRHVDLMRNFGCQLMEIKCRHKANHSLRHPEGDGCQVEVIKRRQFRQPVPTAADRPSNVNK